MRITPYLCEACQDENHECIKWVLNAKRVRPCQVCQRVAECSMSLIKDNVQLVELQRGTYEIVKPKRKKGLKEAIEELRSINK